MITEYPVINYVDLEFKRPTGGFILGSSRLGYDTLQPADVAVQWVSYIGKATSVAITRGGKADGVGYSADVGTLSVTIINGANPLDNTDIKPSIPVRLRHKGTGQLLFTGSIVDINTSHKFDKTANRWTDFVTLTAVDAVQSHANITRYGATVEPQTFADRIAALSSSAVAPVAAPQSTTPYNLGGTVYEGSLAAHFDMTVNSVGARWWVDTNGVTQFKRGSAGESAVATFTDQPGTGLHYTDVETAFDTRSLVNDLTLRWHDTKVGDDGNTVADDRDLNYKSFQSVLDYSPRAGSIDVALYSQGDMDNRAGEILAAYSSTSLRVSRLVWNAQDAQGSAPALELSALISVTFRGMTGTYRITNMSHDISPTRWLITLNISKAG